MLFNAPGNINKGKLIVNRFTVSDLVVAGCGIVISYLLVNALFGYVNVITPPLIVMVLSPMALAISIVLPIGNYHNMVMFLKIVIAYLAKEKKYYWEGLYRLR